MSSYDVSIPAKPRKFDTEAELCSVFIDVARSQGLKVYSEAGGIDLVVVYTEEFLEHYRSRFPYFRADRGPYIGEQLAIEAKMRGGLDVLNQVISRRQRSYKAGPTYWGVLVPPKQARNHSFRGVASELGIHVSTLSPDDARHTVHELMPARWIRRHNYSKPIWLPDVEIDVGAGSSSPRTVSRWKVGAVKLCLLAKKQGYLLRKDFKDHGISMTLWYARKWIRRTGSQGRLAVYELCEENQPPHILYPDVAEALDEVS